MTVRAPVGDHFPEQEFDVPRTQLAPGHADEIGKAASLLADGSREKSGFGEVRMRTKRTIGAAAILGILGAAGLGGCDIVVGIGIYCTEGKDPGCGAAGAGANGGTGGVGGTTTSSVTGGAGGTTSSTGGGGTGGGPECSQGQTEVCYSGPTGTVGVGICKPGTHACQPDGTWGVCGGEITPLAEDCFKAEDEDCNFGVGCSETVWSQIFGDPSSQYVRSVAYDAQGNLFAVGSFSGTLNFGGDPLISSGNDVFVAKFDLQGNHLWSHRYGDAAQQSAQGMAVDLEGNVVVVGRFAGVMNVEQTVLTAVQGDDVFVLKFDPNGNKVWARQFGDAGVQQQASSVAVDQTTGEIVLTGSFDGALDFDGKKVSTSGEADVFLAKLSNDGTGVWAKRFGDTQSQYGIRLALDPLGNILLAGQFAGTIDLGAGNVFTNGSGDVFLARFDTAGASSWAKRLEVVAVAQPTGLVSDSAGNVIVAVETNTNIDPGGGTVVVSAYDTVLAKYSSGGIYQWQKQLGGAGDEYGPSLAADTNNRIVLSFYSNGPLNLGGGALSPGGGLDIIVSALEPDGELRWAKRYGAVGDQTSPIVAVGPKGQIAIGCTATGSIDFGTGNLMSAGTDVVLAEIGPN